MQDLYQVGIILSRGDLAALTRGERVTLVQHHRHTFGKGNNENPHDHIYTIEIAHEIGYAEMLDAVTTAMDISNMEDGT